MAVNRWLMLSAAMFLAVQALALGIGVLPSPNVALFDPDAYARLLKVEQLAITGRWWDGTIAALDAPFGLSMHWTRPLDVLILAVAMPLAQVFDLHEAVTAAGVVVSPMLGLATIGVLHFGVGGIVGERRFALAMLLLALQRGVLQAFAFGRPDHHSLLLFLLAAAFALLVRHLAAPGEGRCRPVLLGLTGALALWVSIEGLLIVLFCLLCLGGAAVRSGGKALRDLSRFCLALAGGCLAALALERPPAEWAGDELDRLSAVHLSLVWLMAAAAAVLDRFRPSGAAARLSAGAALAALVAAAMAALHPGFFHGPFAEIGPLARRMVVGRVTELQPLWPSTPAALLNALIELGGLPVAAAMVVWQIVRARGPSCVLAVTGAAGLAVFVPAALHLMREAPAAQLFLVLPMSQACFVGAGCVGRAWAGGRHLRAAGLAVTLAVLVAGGAGSAGLIHATRWQGLHFAERSACGYGALAAAAAGTGAVLAYPLEEGPAVAWTSGRPAVAGPYHRNEDGIRDTLLVFGAMEPDRAAIDVLRRRGIGTVVVCRRLAPVDIDPRRLVSRLSRGEVPGWLVPVALPAPASDDLLLYRVVGRWPD
jgi:hypothetical protein